MHPCWWAGAAMTDRRGNAIGESRLQNIPFISEGRYQVNQRKSTK
jgi:hypothetical protein